MPAVLRLLLRPQDLSRAALVPAAQLHGLACALLEGAGADHEAQVKPFSVAPLLEAPDLPGHAFLRLGWLDDARVAGLRDHALDQIGGALRTGSQYFTVTDADMEAQPYAHFLAQGARFATFTFLTTTYFNRGDRQVPLPDPELVFAGLARRWNAWSPVPIPGDVIHELCATVLVTSHDIASGTADLGKAQRTGFRGRATFSLPRDISTDTATAFAALSRFAAIAGVGAQTTRGLGNVTTDLTPMDTRQHSQPRTGARQASRRTRNDREHASRTGSRTP